jgi:ankyrin repeat protein
MDSRLEEQLKKLEELQEQILGDLDAGDLATPEKVIEFKHDRLTKLVKDFSKLLHTSDAGYLEDPLTTGLHVAARDGRTKTVEALLAAGAAADAIDKSGCTSLWHACYNKHEAAAAVLMEATKRAGALDLLAKTDGNGSALHVASAKGLGSTVAKLLSLGANATLKDDNPMVTRTPLELAEHELCSSYDDERKKLGQDVKAAFAKHWSQVDITNENKNALLKICASLGIASRLPAVLQAGADPALKDENDCTSLWHACFNKHEAAAAELMEATKRAGALDLQDKHMHKRSALQVASANGLVSTVKGLLSLGANAALVDKSGNTSLMVAIENKQEPAAAELMEATKRAGALDLQDTSTWSTRSALHLASVNGLGSTVAKLLSLGADAALKEYSGCTSLWLACEKKHEAAAAELIEATKRAGALDTQDNECKMSPLHMASARGLESTVAKLLSLGADITLKEKSGKTPLELAQGEGVKAAFAKHWSQVDITNENKNALLKICASLGIASRLPAVLQAGADPALKDENDCTSLWHACFNKHEAAAAELMEATKRAGALDLQNKGRSMSALHVASFHGLGSIIAKLLSQGANAALRDSDGKTSLWIAIENKHESAAAELMEATKRAGALDLQDNSNKMSPLHVASILGLGGTVAKLLSHGANAALQVADGRTPVDLANDEVKKVFAEFALSPQSAQGQI